MYVKPNRVDLERLPCVGDDECGGGWLVEARA